MFILKFYFALTFMFLIQLCVCFDFLGLDTGQMGTLAWDIQFKRLEDCKDQGSRLINFDVRLRRVSRTRVDLLGNVTCKVDLGDNIKIVTDFSYWGNGGWKSNAYRFTIKNACSEYSVFKNFLMALRKECGMPLTTCPIPKGTYELKSLDTNIINNNSIPLFNIPMLWRITFAPYEKSENKLLGCKILIAESRVKQLKNDKKVKKT